MNTAPRMISGLNLLLRERDQLREALAALHAWVLAEHDDFMCSAGHPFAQAAAVLAAHGEPTGAEEREDGDMPPLLKAAYAYVLGIDPSYGARFNNFQMAQAFEAGAEWQRSSGAKEVCRFPECKCPMDPGTALDWCAIGLPHAPC